jgi:D-alanine-D-alanine ligase
MRIGFTYDLRKDYLERGYSEEETAEFDSEETVQIIADTISSLGHEVIRIGNVYELVKRISSGERWELVFNITEGLNGRSREAQVPAVLEAYHIPYTFSDPLTLALCLDKFLTKTVVSRWNIPTPDFFQVSSRKGLDDVLRDNRIPFPLFLKPVSEGTGKGVTPASVIRSPEQLRKQCRELLERYGQPALVEKYLPGREFTVGIVGSGEKAKVVGVLEVELLDSAEPLVYSYVNKEYCEQHVRYVLNEDPEIFREAAEISMRAYKALDCRDAGRVDIRADENGKLHFLEINPLAGLHPTHSDLPILWQKTGRPYHELIAEILSSASSRNKSEVGR